MKVRELLINETKQAPTLVTKRYYKVDFKDKEIAKKMGLKWDAEEKSWFYGIYNTSGATAKQNISAADEKFGEGVDKPVSEITKKSQTADSVKDDKTTELSKKEKDDALSIAKKYVEENKGWSLDTVPPYRANGSIVVRAYAGRSSAYILIDDNGKASSFID
jgi:hypothetical protein